MGNATTLLLVEKLELEILGLSSSQSQTGSFALVLGEKEGKRRLPIIIGMFEAQAIAIEIEKISPNRPMTHDLFKEFASGFNYHVQEIVITELKEGVFFANIVCSDEIKTITIDSRPSDAIAIAIRFNAPIYTNEKIMSEAGIILSDIEEEELAGAEEDQVEEEEALVEMPKDDVPLEEYPSDELNVLLNESLAAENYEMAAKIRDILEKRKS